MSRSGGYKCYNTRCSSCLGKTLRTEPGDTALSCQDRVFEGERTDMAYKKLAADLLSGCAENCADCEYAGDSEFECTIAKLAAAAITDLIARAEAAEAAQESLKRAMAEYKDRAEKAERELNKLLDEEEKVPFDPF